MVFYAIEVFWKVLKAVFKTKGQFLFEVCQTMIYMFISAQSTAYLESFSYCLTFCCMQAALPKTGHIFFQMDGCQGSGSTTRLSFYPSERISTLLNVNVHFYYREFWCFLKSFSTSHFYYMLIVLTRNYQKVWTLSTILSFAWKTAFKKQDPVSIFKGESTQLGRRNTT